MKASITLTLTPTLTLILRNSPFSLSGEAQKLVLLRIKYCKKLLAFIYIIIKYYQELKLDLLQLGKVDYNSILLKIKTYFILFR